MGSLLQYDLQLLKFINLQLASPLLTRIMLIITDKHNWYPFIAGAIILLLFAGRKLPHPGNRFVRINPRVFILGLILCIALTDQVGTFLKHNVRRTRPNRDETVAAQLDCRLQTGGRRSFPSNHSANSAGLAVFTALVYPPVAIPAVLFTLLVGFSRVYLAVHYPSDVIAGWLIGSLTGLLVWFVLRKRLSKPGITGFANMFRFHQHQSAGSPGKMWSEKRWTSLDGYAVKGYLLKGSEKLIIFAHGLGGSFLSRAELGEKLRDLNGASFLLVPMRGSDDHPARLATGGTDEVHDILGALMFAKSAGFSCDNIVVYGTSMGGSSAVKACSVAGELIPAGIVIHGAFSSFFVAARHRTGRAGAALLRLLMPGRVVRSLDRFSPLFWLACLNRGCGVEYIYGDGDRVSPPEEGELMAEHTCSDVCCITVLKGQGHPTGRNASEDDLVIALNNSLDRIWKRNKGEC
ncbi:MAG: phosphatase PAP2 family protein [Candidatus Sabulitectum sp.]|nr:phosphatase PAP2 family protein [Candidatus Sabulitectum sp.]